MRKIRYSSGVMPEKVFTLLVIWKTLLEELMPLGIAASGSERIVIELPVRPRLNVVTPEVPEIVSIV